MDLPDWLASIWRGHPLWQLEAAGARTWLENEVTRMENDPGRVHNPAEEQILDGYRDDLTAAVDKKYSSLAERLRDWRSGAGDRAGVALISRCQSDPVVTPACG
jgi:hypothetical protein